MGRDSIIRAKMLELFIFIGILVVITGLLGYVAIYAGNTAPPHAGLDVKDDGSYVSISVTTMGQSDRVTVVTNGTIEENITRVSQRVSVSKTPNKTKQVYIISDNGRQSLLLREFKV